MIERLGCIPGITHFLEVHEYPLGDFDDILDKCRLHFGSQLPGKIFAVRCKRAGKHPLPPMQVEAHVGSHLRREFSAAGIDLKQPQVEVRMEIRHERLYIIDHQHQGLGGYPLGSVDQSLVLMSGGFDSTVAAYQMMRRGLLTHFCFFTSVVVPMNWASWKWRTFSGKYGSSHRVLFLSVPFEEVVAEILGKVDNNQMGVVLKRVLRVASLLAEELHIDALVTGEAISQVSSQTLANLKVIDAATDMLVRPLIASHKQDIIDTATQIGTAEFARHMPEYCGVISVNPTTRAKPARIEHEESLCDPQILARALSRVRRITVDRVIEELGDDLQVEEVREVLAGQVLV